MRLPKYRRHSSSNRAFVEHGGKRHYLAGAFNSPESVAAYRAFIRDVCGGVVSGGPVGTLPSTVASLVSRFLQWAERYYPDPRGTYLNLVSATTPLVEQFGNLPPAEFGPKKLKELQQILADAKLSRQYVNDITRRIKQCFKWATSEELIPPAIFQALSTVTGIQKGRTPAIEPPPREPVAWEHVEPVLPFLSPTIRAMVELHWLTGARSRSICLARPEQFRVDVTPWEWHPRHKTEYRGTKLVIYLGPKARALLTPFLVAPPTAYIFRPTRRHKRYGGFYTSASYRLAVDKGIQRANAKRAAEDAELPKDERRKPIPHWTPHQIRHSKSTITREAHGLEAAQAMLGQQSIQAAQIYAARQSKEAKRIAELEG